MVNGKPLIVGIGGTSRSHSSSEHALRQVLRHLEVMGADIELYTGHMLSSLPIYGGDQVVQSRLRDQFIQSLRDADGVVISSPCYHGGVSGLIKNALDYVEDMRDDSRKYLDGRVVGVIACAYGNQGVGVVLSQLRQIVHALRGWPTPIGVGINSLEVRLTAEDCSDASTTQQIKLMADQLLQFVPRMTAVTA